MTLCVKAGNVETCRRYLAEAGMDCVVYTGVNSEPTDIHLDEALVICKTQQCDVVIALGEATVSILEKRLPL